MLNGANVLFNFEAGLHHFVSAFETFYLQIRTDSTHLPLVTPAGMGFFHYENITNRDFHTHFPFTACQ